MSALGGVDDGDRRGWQQTAFDGLTTLIKVGHEVKLPPLCWTLLDHMEVRGRVGPYRGHDPRKVWWEWLTALVDLCGQPVQHQDEYTDSAGQTRLMAKFHLRTTESDLPRVDIVLIAEFWLEEYSEPAR